MCKINFKNWKALDFGKKKKKKKVKDDLLKDAEAESSPATLASSTISPLGDKENKDLAENSGAATTSAGAADNEEDLDFEKKKKKKKPVVKFDVDQNEVIEVCSR